MSIQLLRKIIKPRCDECDSTAATHPYPKPDATEWQLNGSVAGGYRWLCGDCAYIEEHGEAERIPRPPRTSSPPQRERLFDI